MNFLRFFIAGIIVGIANVIPGVSGGTLAVVFNIYDELVNSITLNVKKLFAKRGFLIPVFLGVIVGIFGFSKLISFLYSHFPSQTNYTFTGLILGSIPMIFGYMTKKPDYENNENGRFSTGKIIGLVICFVAGFVVLSFSAYFDCLVADKTIVHGTLPDFSVKYAVLFFVAGVIGAVAMIIPGISGSLIMLIMGVYYIVILSIQELFNPQEMVHAVLLLTPFGFGVIAGLLGGAKLISILLKHCPNYTYAVILGLICASALRLTLYYGFEKNPVTIITGILCMVAGFAAAFFSSKMTASEKKSE